MQSKKLPILIVGSDSLIGRALMKHLELAGDRVTGTTRRHEAVNNSNVYLDLSEELTGWNCPVFGGVAVICAGVTKLEECKRNPQASRRVNVKGITELVKILSGRDMFVIFLSTNLVFDGSTPHCLHDEPVSPLTQYGKQKAETEEQIRILTNSAAIVRFTKIFGDRIPIFATWSEALKNGKTIHPFSDMYISPVPLTYAVSVLRLLIYSRLSGIIQASAGSDISYAEAAHLGAKYIGADEYLVQPIQASQSGICLDHVPAHTTLDTNLLKSTLGIEPPAVNWTIKTAFTKPRLLSGPF